MAYRIRRNADYGYLKTKGKNETMIPGIIKGKQRKPPRILVYGTEGIGKSTFASTAPDPIFISCEDGLGNIDCESFPLATHWDDVINQLAMLVKEEHSYKTIVIDSLDWMERLIWQKLCEAFSVTSIEKVDGGYGKGYVHALTYWNKAITLLTELRNKKEMIVLLLAHAAVESYSDPETSEINRYKPRLHKQATSLICEWVDNVFLATREHGAIKGDEKGGARILRTEGTALCVGKNRYGLTPVLPLSWASLMDDMARARKQNAGGNGGNA